MNKEAQEMKTRSPILWYSRPTKVTALLLLLRTGALIPVLAPVLSYLSHISMVQLSSARYLCEVCWIEREGELTVS